MPKEEPVSQDDSIVESKIEKKSEAKTESKPITKIESNNETNKENKTVIKEEKQESEKTQIEEKKENNQPEQTIDFNVLLQEAQLLYNEKEYKKANEKVDLFLENSTQKQDEALFLKGQILEAKSDIQNIKNSIAAYTTLTKNYPASKYWDDANKRIIYLKRFYLEVR